MSGYEEYRVLPFPWLPEIPNHWALKKFRHLFSFSRGLSITKADLKDIGIPCVSYGEIHSKYGFEVDPVKNQLKCVSEEYIQSSPESLLTSGDFVFADTSEDIEGSGNFTYLNSNLPTFAGYHTIIAKPAVKFFHRYMAYFFDSIGYRTQIRRLVNGTKVYSITQSILKSTDIVLPPLEEQTAIANYLDNKTAQIDTLIEKKQKLIELLREERKAIINDAVSGEEKNWEKKKLKYLLKEVKGALKRGPFGSDLKNSDVSTTGPIKVYTQRNVIENDFDVGQDYISKEKFNELSVFEISEGDILVTTRGTIGRTAIFPKDAERGIIHPCLIKMQIDTNKVLCDWLILFFNDSSFFQEDVKRSSNSTIIDVIYGYTLREVVVPVPNPEEQRKILQSLKIQIDRIDSTARKAEDELGLLLEYKKALISEVVTGKVKVI